MKRFPTLLLLFVLPLLASAQFRGDSAFESLYDSETTASIKSHVAFLASAQMEGRKAGSEGEKMAAEYVYSQLSAAGVDMLSPSSGDTFGISSEKGDTLISRNVFGYVPGYDKALKGHYIVVGARLDNIGTNMMTVDGQPVESIYFGANGNASGLSLLIELAKKVATQSIMFRRSVIFVAFGSSCSTMAGSWYFLNRSFEDADKIDAMIDLDMLGVPVDDKFYAYTASNSDLNAILSTVAGSLQPVTPSVVAYEPYPSDHRAFYDKGIPAVLFTTGRYPEHNSPRDTPSLLDYQFMERELEYVFNFAQTLSNTNHQLLFHPELAMTREKGRGGDDVVPYYDCDVKPMFLNSPDPAIFMSKWVYQYLKYPEEAVRNGIQGTVQVSFIIEKSGEISKVQVVRGIDPLLDEEAVRVVSASPKWRAARAKGEKVRSTMTIGVEFRLTRKGERRRFGINGY